MASRLESLGALTQGDRRAAAGASDLGDFNVDTKWGTQVRILLARINSKLKSKEKKESV